VVVSRVLLNGSASGRALVLDEPLSMWGGLDPATGEIIDRRHPQCGLDVKGRILVLPHGRGSSSAASVLAEAIRLGTAPAAIVLAEPDDIILLGALAAEELYAITCPIVVADPDEYAALTTGDPVEVDAAGLRLGPTDRGRSDLGA
jgi:predicted aconitase with swiveling domain